MNTKIDEKTKIQKSYSIIFVGIQYSMCMKTMLHYQSCGSAFIFAVFLSKRNRSRIRIQLKKLRKKLPCKDFSAIEKNKKIAQK